MPLIKGSTSKQVRCIYYVTYVSMPTAKAKLCFSPRLYIDKHFFMIKHELRGQFYKEKNVIFFCETVILKDILVPDFSYVLYNYNF